MCDLFLDPKVTQHGNHMVMSNVNKPTKRKYINIDTRFCDELNPANTIILPQRINDIKSIKVVNVEMPMSLYNVSSFIGNTSFKVTDLSLNPTSKIIDVSAGYYTDASFVTAVNAALHEYDLSLSYSITNNRSVFTNATTHPITIGFDIGPTGKDKYNLNAKIGWTMGFRDASYSTPLTSEAFVSLNQRYLYLAIDEFNNNQNSFVSPIASNLINKNIIAKIPLNYAMFPYGSTLALNTYTGLVSDKRSYNGKVDLQKIYIQLLNEWGNPVDLNGLDYSFCLEVEYE